MIARTEPTKEEPRDPDRGWALVSVLLVVAVLTMMAVATEALILTSTRIEGRTLQRDRTGADLDAAIDRAVLSIADPRIEQRWRVDGTAQTFQFDGQSIRVSVQDELGRIDLNAADGSLLLQLLQSAGIDANTSEVLRDRILDWRSAVGDLRRLHGATDADYAAAGYRYRPRHGPFQSIAELQMVMGVTQAVYAQLKPAITVYSGSPTIDPNTAPAEALRALYPNDAAAVSNILSKRTGSGLPDASDAQNVPATHPGVIPLAVSLAGRTFSIEADTQMDGRRFSRAAVIRLTGDSQKPYLVLAWQ